MNVKTHYRAAPA